MTPVRQAVATIEARTGLHIAGRLVDMRPDIRTAVKLLARQYIKLRRMDQ